MTRVKVQMKKEFSDVDWLKRLWYRAGIPVRSAEALVPVTEPFASVTSAVSNRLLASSKLRARAEQIVQKAQNYGLPIFPVAIAPLFGGWRLHTRSPHYDYVFCNLAEDPLFQDPDGFPIPQKVLDHLRRLAQVGLDCEFDLLYVVHEVEKGTISEGERLNPDKLVPPSPLTQRASKQLGTLGMGLWLGAAVPLMAGAGLAMAGSLAMVPLGLDPLLLGAVVAPDCSVQAGELAVWFYLTHWHYTDDGEVDR